MRRREFIAGLGSAAALPVVAPAQQRTIPVVGVLGSTTSETFPLAVFMQGLKETGFIEGQNLRVEQRWANNLVRTQVSLIAAVGNNLPARAARSCAALTTSQIDGRFAPDSGRVGPEIDRPCRAA
jgi:putative ABC transport system substrate-binding protein